MTLEDEINKNDKLNEENDQKNEIIFLNNKKAVAIFIEQLLNI